ncbi:MAG TPA: Smr/MutS family protein [Phenylobacterium sp.]|nr:Smr/MutS family protein [Phenylobacterium sp.]
MKRPLKPDELRVWGLVAATVHPLPGRETPAEPAESFPSPSWGGAGREATGVGKPGSSAAPGRDFPTRPGLRPGHPPHEGEGKGIEPRRKHRIVRDREPIGARLDLHGMDQDRARGVLEGFLRRAWDEGYRAVLVITGKGVQGDGVLRRRAPEWLAAPHLGAIVAGISEAHRRHGGEGALYVALKRKPRA